MDSLHLADGVEKSPAAAADRLRDFRGELYGCLDQRGDELFELTDALLCIDGPVHTLVGLCLAPEHRRGHDALYDAVNAGRVDVERLRRVLTRLPLSRMFGGRASWSRQFSPGRIRMHCIRRALVAAGACLVGLIGVPALAQPATATAAPTPPSAFVDVSVATVWTSPTSARPIDLPALTNPVDIQGWLASMTTAQKMDLTSGNRTQTQALYGQPVYVLATQGDWDEIAVPGQPTSKNPLGYPGWVPKAQLDTSATAFAALHRSRPFALIDRAATAWLYDDPLLTHRDLRLSVNTRLPMLARTPHAILVATPGAGPKWLSAQDATVYHSDRDIPYPTGTELVRFAETFVGWPYLWAGRSGFAFDCSGFTSTLYQTHGITIGRDADVQARDSGGTPVARDDLQLGDLLFYADAKGTGSIYHVAMYAGNGQMIEAYDAATPVRVTLVRFGTDYWGAERYLHGN